jgi:hypothetical protein
MESLAQPPAWKSGWQDLRRSPTLWVLAGTAALFLVGLGWGLPASDTWDNDGVAPRDFLVAVVETFDKGSFDVAYLHLAPVHLLLLTLLTLPITLSAVLGSHGAGPLALVHEIVQTPYMTAIAWVARSVSVAMALAQVWALGKIGEELRGRRAGALVAAVAGLNVGLVYYAHTTNLEVPHLFWASLALLELVRALARREPRRLRRLAVLGALAIGTKDQAAGIFVLGAPLAIGFWWFSDAWAKTHRAEVAREALVALGLALAVFLVTDEVVINPTGFAARVRFLLGPASSDHAEYTRDAAGRLAVLADIVLHFSWFLPVALAPLPLVGLVAVLRAPSGVDHAAAEPRACRDTRAAGLVPMWAALSFVVAINFTTLRTEHRFTLFPMEMLGIYAGLGLDFVLAAAEARSKTTARLAWILVGGVFAWGVFKAAGVDAVLLFDPRYDAEEWMRVHVAPGDLVETYGLNVYLPRFPGSARVERVAPEPTFGRSPLAGVTEIQDAWDRLSERRPRWIVISDAWVWHYMKDPPPEAHGRILPRAQAEEAKDGVASRYFRALLGGELGYRKARLFRWTSSLWPAVQIHASTGESIWMLERVETRQ